MRNPANSSNTAFLSSDLLQNGNRKSITLSKDSLFCIFCFILIKLAIDFSYVYFVSPLYAYAGLLTDINVLKLAESYLLVFLLGLYYPKNLRIPSDFLLFFFYLTLFIPMASIYALKNGNFLFFYAICFCFVLMKSGRKLASWFRIPTVKSGRKIFIAFAFLAILGMFSLIFARGGMSSFNLNIWKVYELRRVAGATIYSGAFAYIMPLVGKVLLPSLFAYCLWKSKKTGALLLLFLEILYFGFTHHKTMLLYPFLSLGIFFFFKTSNPLRKILSAFIFLLLSSIILFAVFDSITLLTLFIRRALFVTADLHFVYYDFFRDFGQIFMSNSILSNLIPYPLDMPVPNMISLFYTGHDRTWMNAGFLATGYMHFGYLGMFAFSLIASILFALVDKISKNSLPMWLSICIVFPSFMSLSSSDLTTSLKTHGILLSLIVLWFISSNKRFSIPNGSPSSKWIQKQIN